MTTDPILQDQKKRTSDALQRRFALAEAELHVQQQKNKKIPREENKEVTLDVISSSADVTDALLRPSSNASSKKGNFSFSGHTTAQDVEANHAAYFELSHPVHENLLLTSLKISDRTGNAVSRVLHDLLQSGDSAQKYMQGSRSMKIDNFILLDNVVQGHSRSLDARVRALQTHSKRSKKHLSMKQRRRCGSLDLPQEFYNFDIFKPMHEMWKGYMNQLLKSVGKNQFAQYLLTADLHGAMILVVQCKVASYTGVTGIMIRETTETFGIITQDNKFRGNPFAWKHFFFYSIYTCGLVHCTTYMMGQNPFSFTGVWPCGTLALDANSSQFTHHFDREYPFIHRFHPHPPFPLILLRFLFIVSFSFFFGVVSLLFAVVPKRLSVFMFQVDCWKITLHGDKLTSRNVGS